MAAKNRNEETGVILKIQRQTGCLLLIIGAAMLAFVLTDLFKSGPSAFNQTQNVIGEIAGDKIDYNDFMAKVDERRDLYITNDPNRIPDDKSLREEAWNILVNERIVKSQHDELGLTLSAEEFSDVTVGNNPHQRIVNAFQNPETNTYDRNRFIQFLESDIQEDDQLRKRWLLFFEEPIKEEIVAQKYDKYVKSGVYYTTLDAKAMMSEDDEISAQAVGLPYTQIADSTITFNDKELRRFIADHPDKFEQQASRSIKFVVVNIFPSSEDSANVRKWAYDYVDRFKKAKDDSTFVNIHRSETPFDPAYKPRGTFASDVEDAIFAADSGTVIGPIYQEGVWSLYKIADVSEDSIARKRARHIHIPVMGATDQDTAKALADARAKLAEIRSGETTWEEASRSNLDGTGRNGGDLGWLPKEGMVFKVSEELRDKIFANANGSVFISQERDGAHIVEVTSNESSKTVQVAVLNRTITPGNETDRAAEREAAEIQYQVEQGKDFNEVVENAGYTVREGTKIREDNQVVPGIQEPTTIVRWLYEDDTRTGDVSDVLDLNDRYVVAQCTEILEEGTMELENVRDAATIEYLKDKKGEILSEQIAAAQAKASDLESLASALNTAVRPIPVLSFTSSSIPGTGVDPELVGVMFGLNEQEMSEPVAGNTGVYVLQVTGSIPKGDDIDPEAIRVQKFGEFMGTVDAKILEALQNAAEIKDKRYKYF